MKVRTLWGRKGRWLGDVYFIFGVVFSDLISKCAIGIVFVLRQFSHNFELSMFVCYIWDSTCLSFVLIGMLFVLLNMGFNSLAFRYYG